MDLEYASKLLWHTEQEITRKVYRRVGETMMPTKWFSRVAETINKNSYKSMTSKAIQMLHKHMAALLLTSCVISLPFSSFAADSLGINAQETYQQKQQAHNKVLIIDVRDPVEIMFMGNTDIAHANIPYMLVNRTQWDKENNRFQMQTNPELVKQIETLLHKRGLNKDNAIVITICRSGSECDQPSADLFQRNGFKKARHVIHGLQGSVAKNGEKAGMRIVNDWKNSGLPWSSKLNPEKIYRVNIAVI